MKYYLIILSFLFSLDMAAQAFKVDRQPMCWVTSNNVDSSLNRFTLVSPRNSNLVLNFLYTNGAGARVDISSGGRLWYGYCGECTRDTLPIPRIEGFSVSEPTINVFNPSACGSILVATVYGVTDANSQIVVTVNNVPVSFNYSAATRSLTAESNPGSGSGIHNFKLTVTIPSGTAVMAKDFDCQ